MSIATYLAPPTNAPFILGFGGGGLTPFPVPKHRSIQPGRVAYVVRILRGCHCMLKQDDVNQCSDGIGKISPIYKTLNDIGTVLFYDMI